MDDNLNRPWPAYVFAGLVLGLALSTGLVSCRSGFSPRQGWNPSYGPVVPHDKFPGDCALCHTGGNWTTIRKDFTFDHAKQTGVELKGAHANVGCLLCHNDRGKAGAFASRGCAGCHVDIHRGRLGNLCSSCHNEDTWRPVAQIAKHNRTRFPLVGAHAAAACFACHPGAQVGNFEGADTRCLTCHGADLARATSPSHASAEFNHDCQRCHQPTGWKPANFKHPAAFPLVGGHAAAACTACHTSGTYTTLSTDCASCHMDKYAATTNPNHAASGFGTNCKSCHSVNSWLGAKFNHPAAFPLTGGHGGVACAACHKGGVYTGLSTACATCHMDKYQATTDPNHAASGFGTDCQSCHTTTTWLGAKFTHPAAFPLTGGHGGIACASCHKGGSYTALPTACVSCHLDKYQATTSPNHATAGFGTDCQSCHTTATWAGATFKHTAFPLTGPHNVACNQCHPNAATPTDFICTICHTQAATTPRHSDVGGYVWDSRHCYQCHSRGVVGGNIARPTIRRGNKR